MSNQRAASIQRITEAVLTGPGETDPGLRSAIEVYSAEAGGRISGQVGELPAELVGYVDKVARHAYKVTDADIAALRSAGYSEDAIFEITLSTALGAAKARLERGFAAVREEAEDATQQA